MHYDLLIIFELILPQNPMEKYEEKLYLEYLLKNFVEKTEDMIDEICPEYLFKNLYEKNLDRKTHLGKEYNI